MNEAKRVALSDAEQMIQALLPDVKAEDLGTEVLRIVASSCEQKGAWAPAAADGEGEMSARADGETAPPAPPPAADAQRGAVAGLADEAAKDKFIADVLAALVNAGVTSDANDAASALAAVQAMPPKSEGGGDAAGDPTQQMGAAAARSASVAAAAEQMRADIVNMKRELEELRPLRDEKRARDHADHVDGEAKRRGITLTTAVRAKLLKMDKAGVDAALDLVAQPPTGLVMGNVGDSESEPVSVTEAIDSLVPEALKSAPKGGEPAAHTRSRATRMAKSRWPSLFGAVPASDD